MCVCVCIYYMQVAKLFREKETTNSKGGTRKGEDGFVEGTCSKHSKYFYRLIFCQFDTGWCY